MASAKQAVAFAKVQLSGKCYKQTTPGHMLDYGCQPEGCTRCLLSVISLLKSAKAVLFEHYVLCGRKQPPCLLSL